MFVLTFVPSDEQLLAGIPRTVEITASEPATIYYTLDGSLPTPMGLVYVGEILMPSNSGEVILSAIAYYLDGYGDLVPSAVLSETYSTDHSDLRGRLKFFEGVVYITPGSPDFPFYYDLNGDASVFVDVDPEELDLLVSDRDVSGAPVDNSAAVEIMSVEATPTLFDNTPAGFSTPNGTAFFDPNASFILVDGRVGAAEQQVRLINGPNMTLRDSRKTFGGIDFYSLHGENYVSGTSLKPMYDRQKGVIVFNYHDTNANRWVKSIQTLEAAPATVPVISHGPRLVFKWFVFGRPSGV